MNQILISTCGVTLKASLNDTITAREIWKTLPIKGHVSIWGEEIYFTIPMRIAIEPGATQEVEVGTIAYWPAGPALCIFFGQTPVSTGLKPRAYSPVNIIGQAMDDPTSLKGVSEGDEILIKALEE
jgi:hypothetical protein